MQLPRNATLDCHNDITCFPAWETKSNAVALVLLSGGDYWCSGALLNNTAKDYKPYFLSAFHCIDTNQDDLLSNAEILASENWAFRFKFKRNTCNGNSIDSHITYNRATFKAAWNVTDFLLLELNSIITNSFISFLGWDRTGNTPSLGTGIHHPAGDVMKISFDYHPLISNSSIINWGYSTSPASTHWVVGFDNGTTEGGSSGSPLFNQNGLVIGQLHGGTRSCPPVNKYYGQFHKSWTGGGTNSTRLSNWLDPIGSDATTLDIIQTLDPVLGGPSTFCNTATFSLYHFPQHYYPANFAINWSCSSGLRILNSTRTSVTVQDINPSLSNEWVKAQFLWLTVTANATAGFTYPTNVQTHSSVRLPVGTSVEFAPTPPPGFDKYTWRVSPTSATISTTYCPTIVCSKVRILFNEVANYVIQAFPTNECGVGSAPSHVYTYITYRPGYSYSVYPDSNSNVIYIELNENEEATNKSAIQKTTNDFELNIRLYNIQGNIVRNITSRSHNATISTADLPNGNYIIHIYNNNSDKPETQQIVIQH